jgi:hypothetical protein
LNQANDVTENRKVDRSEMSRPIGGMETNDCAGDEERGFGPGKRNRGTPYGTHVLLV